MLKELDRANLRHGVWLEGEVANIGKNIDNNGPGFEFFGLKVRAGDVFVDFGAVVVVHGGLVQID